MKTLAAVALSSLFIAPVAQAITIDFESPPTASTDTSVTTQGFTFTATGPYESTWLPNSGIWNNPTENLSYCGDCVLTIEAENQSLFDLNSFDFTNSGSTDPAMTVTGYKAGQLVATTAIVVASQQFNTFSFDSAWQGLDRVEFDAMPAIASFVDNVDVSVVPVPAAVWLFASALAGLGWMRRKPLV